MNFSGDTSTDVCTFLDSIACCDVISNADSSGHNSQHSACLPEAVAAASTTAQSVSSVRAGVQRPQPSGGVVLVRPAPATPASPSPSPVKLLVSASKTAGTPRPVNVMAVACNVSTLSSPRATHTGTATAILHHQQGGQASRPTVCVSPAAVSCGVRREWRHRRDIAGGGGVLSRARLIAPVPTAAACDSPQNDMNPAASPAALQHAVGASLTPLSDAAIRGDNTTAAVRRVYSLQQYRQLRGVSPAAGASHLSQRRQLFAADRLALCGACGALSSNLTRCARCGVMLPRNAPIMERRAAADGGAELTFATRTAAGGGTGGRPSAIRQRRKIIEEPECLTISSSDDEDSATPANTDSLNASGVGSSGGVSGTAACLATEAHSDSLSSNAPNTITTSTTAITTSTSTTGTNTAAAAASASDIKDAASNPATDSDASLGDPTAATATTAGTCLAGEFVCLRARTVRVGSHRCLPAEPVLFSRTTFSCRLPTAARRPQLVKLTLQLAECARLVQVHLGQQLAAVFLHVTVECGRRVSQQLQLAGSTSCKQAGDGGLACFDPAGDDEQTRRITVVLEDPLDEECRRTLLIVLRQLVGERLQLLTAQQTNDILLASSPLPLGLSMRRATAASASLIAAPQPVVTSPASQQYQQLAHLPNATLFQYPPAPARGAVPVSVVDYTCLDDEQFLNDIIIDFYLKYLVSGRLAPADRERTHVFSSFFYQRLTTRTNHRTPRSTSTAAGEAATAAKTAVDVAAAARATAAHKRHARVKGWTKNVDIFSKDFLLVPINEHSHWFLAIVCFAGLSGCRRLCDNQPCDRPQSCARPQSCDRPQSSSVATAAVARDRPSTWTAPNATNDGPARWIGGSSMPLKIGHTLVTPLPSPPPLVSSARASAITTPPCVASEEDSERDEADSDDEDVDSDGEADATPSVESGGNPELTRPAADEREDVSDEAEQEQCPLMQDIAAIDYSHCVHSAIKQPCILIMDSLAGPSRARVVATLRDYLRVEYAVKRAGGVAVASGDGGGLFERNTLRGCCVRVPQQDNFTDCGLYVLQYAESFFQSPLMDFRTPLPSMVGWFPSWRVTHKRRHLARLIGHLAEQQAPGRSLLLPPLSCLTSPPSHPLPPPPSSSADTPQQEEQQPNLTDQPMSPASATNHTSPPAFSLPTSSSEISPSAVESQAVVTGALAAVASSYGGISDESSVDSPPHTPPPPPLKSPSSSPSPVTHLPSTAARLLQQQQRRRQHVESEGLASDGGDGVCKRAAAVMHASSAAKLARRQ